VGWLWYGRGPAHTGCWYTSDGGITCYRYIIDCCITCCWYVIGCCRQGPALIVASGTTL
jgi:hypothetical protein